MKKIELLNSRASGRGVLCAVAATALLLGATAPGAFGAGTPTLSATTMSVPTNLPPGGTGYIRVDLQNIGDAPTDGTPVTVVDKLPPGVTATEAGGIHEENAIVAGIWDCTGIGTEVVTCTNDPTGLPTIVQNEASNENEGPTAPSIGIAVSVSSEASGAEENKVEVSGGGTTTTALSSQPVTLSATAPPFGFASFSSAVINEDGSTDTQAGSHPYSMITHFTLNNTLGRYGTQDPVGNGLKNLQVDLPAGFVGNPLATPRCPRALFNVEQYLHYPTDCPADTQVGYDVVALESDSYRVAIPVYNLVPPPGVPAQFGFAFQKDIGFIDAGVRTGEGYGLKVTLNNVAQLGLIANTLTLWGVPGNYTHDTRRLCTTGNLEKAEAGNEVHIVGCPTVGQSKPFLTNPGSCGPQELTVDAESWLGETAGGSFPIADNREQPSVIDGCESLSFTPTVEVEPETTVADSPSGLDVDLHVPQSEGPTGLAEADLRDATVALPGGMAVSPSAANGLEGCSPSQVNLGSDSPTGCPDAAKIGTAEVITPLLGEPLKGSIYLAQQDNNPFGSLLALYLSVEGSGVVIKLAGEVKADPNTGQLTTKFKDNPQLPFSDLKLDFFGGPRAALVTPSSCGEYQTSSTLTNWSGLAPVNSADAFAISSGCGGGLAPAFTAGTTSNQAGAYSPLTASFSRQDGEQHLGGVQVTLPAGVLGKLASVPLCGESQAAQGTCGAESEIGETTVTAGPGEDPYVVKGGRVYLTGPYEGAPLGLSIVVPAVAGPFNLGNVVVRARVAVNPNTAQITVTTDPLPQMIDSIEGLQSGIPDDIRAIAVTANRPGFTFNPTSCAPMAVTATVTGAQGASATVTTPFEAANCAALPFKPSFTASTQARASKADGASLTVKVAPPAGGSDIAKVDLELPKQFPARLTTLQKACSEAQFNANPAGCPKASVIGSATATTPILKTPLVGPAYLVSHGDAAFPDVEFVLQANERGGVIEIVLDGKTQIKKGVTYSHFETLPDAPITSFTTVLPAGPHSILGTDLPAKARYSLCGQTLAMPTSITGQNGAVVKQTTKIGITGCAKTKTSKKKAKQHKQKGK